MRRIALLATLVICLTSAAAMAQNIGIVNPGRVFADMQETKDLKAKLEIDRKNLETEVQQRQQKVKDLQAARDLLKQDSPQYQQADQSFMSEAIQFDTWSKITQATLQGQQKQQMKSLFDKIVTATQQVAQQKGIDLVIADQRAEDINTQQLNVEQLRAMLNGRNILYSSEKVDLNAAVVAALDANYKASGGAAPAASTPAPAAPAPAPAPAPRK
jgi:Skp family chaperone for outer membrane proteins